MNDRRLAQALEYVGYWRTMPATIDPTNTTTMNPAVIGIGAAVSARAMRPSPCVRDVKCSQTAYIAVIANSARKIQATMNGPILGIALLNGTP